MSSINQTLHTIKRGVFVSALISTAAIIFGVYALAHAQVVPTVALSSIPSQTLTVGDIASFTASATDDDPAATIAYSISGAPSGASIDSGSGAFSWDTTGASAQTYSFTVQADGSTGGSDSKSVSITLNNPAMQNATSTQTTGGTATTTGGTIITGDATATTTVDNTLNTNSANPDQANQHMNSSGLNATSTNQGELGSAATSTAITGDNSVLGGIGINTIETGNAVSTANVINEVNTNIFNSEGLILFINQLFGGGIDLNDWDLSSLFAGSPGASPINKLPGTNSDECTLLTCLNSSKINVIDQNVAPVTNSVIVRSSTGSNTASSTNDAKINTGDAYAAANVVNLVNTNIINSTYLLVAFNNFGNLTDNVILPGADFFDKLFANGSNLPQMNSSTYGLSADNTATTTGSVTANADTGNNVASTTLFTTATSTDPIDPNATSTMASTTIAGNGDITTGKAYSSASSFTEQNTNHVGGTSVFLLFRMAGQFNGHIIGLPAGLTSEMTADGLVIKSADATTTPLSVPGGCTYGYRARSDNSVHYSHVSGDPLFPSSGYQYLGVLGGPCFNSSAFLASATNTAAVENNVDVTAETGKNNATTQNGVAEVNTGNAYASASAVNLINTNIVGQNWIFGVFNIFGDVDGDIVFGEGSPILAVTAAPSLAETAPGTDVTYTFTVGNTGTGTAGDVVLNASYDNTLITFPSGDQSGITMTETPTGASWRVGSLRHGETRTFTVTGHIGTNFPHGQRATVPLTAAAVNTDITSPSTSDTVSAPIVVVSPAVITNTNNNNGGGNNSGGSNSGGGNNSNTQSVSDSGWTPNAQISVTKTAALSTSTSQVNYKVVVYNQKTAGPAYNSALTDTLYDPKGAVVYTRSWDLATVAPGDEIDLTYTVDFAASSTPGKYVNVARITGTQNYGSASTNAMTPVEGRASVQFGAGRVLGIATTTVPVTNVTSPIGACSGTVFSQILRPGNGNNALEVQKLQTFLNRQLGTALPVTGFFGPMTTVAVKQFQIRYASDILAPAGLTVPSGFVGTMTLNKMNALGCGTTTVPVVPTVSSIVQQAAAAVAPTVQVPTPKTTKVVPTVKKTVKVTPKKVVPATPEAPVAPAAPVVPKKSGFVGWISGLF